MIVKSDDTATWVGLESAREIILLGVAIGTMGEISNEIINEKIQEVAHHVEYDETDLVVEGIDAASAREFALDLIRKVVHASQNSEQ